MDNKHPQNEPCEGTELPKAETVKQRKERALVKELRETQAQLQKLQETIEQFLSGE